MYSDAVVLLELDKEERRSRLLSRGLPDYFEKKGPEFEKRVQDGFRQLVDELGGVAINATGTEEEVHERVWHGVTNQLGKIAVEEREA